MTKSSFSQQLRRKKVLTSNRLDSKIFDNNNKSYGKGVLKIEDVFSMSGLLYPTDELDEDQEGCFHWWLNSPSSSSRMEQ